MICVCVIWFVRVYIWSYIMSHPLHTNRVSWLSCEWLIIYIKWFMIHDLCVCSEWLIIHFIINLCVCSEWFMLHDFCVSSEWLIIHFIMIHDLCVCSEWLMIHFIMNSCVSSEWHKFMIHFIMKFLATNNSRYIHDAFHHENSWCISSWICVCFPND